MNYLCFSIPFIIIICILNSYYNKKTKQLTINFDKTIEQLKQTGINDYIQQQKGKLEFEIHSSLRDLEKSRDTIQAEIEGKRAALNEIAQRMHGYEEQLRNTAEIRVQQYEKILMDAAKGRIDEKTLALHKIADDAYAEYLKELENQKANAESTIASLVQQIEQYSSKQKAINEAMARQREIEEQRDFYRVCLTDEALSDISLLQGVRGNLKKPEIIDKIIYDNYIAKPVLEMIKRVLQNTTCSGIYKITCTKTGEVYVGKSTDIKNRWQQHCKTAFNRGTIASSLLHRKMQQYGIENFTFELLEAVPKDKLSEREKFYIDFYKTKETGLNERSG